MTNNQSTLTKICSICGELKPLMLFAQHAGLLGIAYGNVCADCRKAGLDKPKAKTEAEDATTIDTDSGHRIDAKEKIKGDITKKDERDAKKHSAEEERIEEEELKEKELEKKSLKVREEKDRREDKLQKAVEDKQNKAAAVSAHEEGRPDTGQDDKVNTQVEFKDTQIAGKRKFESVAFKHWLSQYGTGTAIGKTMFKGVKPTEPSSMNTNKAENKNEGAKETLKEQLETKFNPGTRKR